MNAKRNGEYVVGMAVNACKLVEFCKTFDAYGRMVVVGAGGGGGGVVILNGVAGVPRY